MYEKRCPYCGSKLSVYYKTGMLGCPECYDWFENEIDQTLQSVQGSTKHIGKRPKYSATEKALIEDYARYLSEKEKALISGRFEDVKKITSILNDIGDELKRRGINP